MQASAPTFSSRKPTTKPLTKHSTPPARRATTPTTPKRTIARWKRASTIISTRESQRSREQVLEIGISQISGGSRTSVGGYAGTTHAEQDSAQFDVSDHRTLDEVVRWLLELGYVPSFCTACYREGRTGDRFMSLAKTGKIANCCTPNALMTLKEYLEDYASPETRTLGEKMIAKEVPMLLNERVRRITEKNLAAIAEGKRDFRF